MSRASWWKTEGYWGLLDPNRGAEGSLQPSSLLWELRTNSSHRKSSYQHQTKLASHKDSFRPPCWLGETLATTMPRLSAPGLWRCHALRSTHRVLKALKQHLRVAEPRPGTPVSCANSGNVLVRSPEPSFTFRVNSSTVFWFYVKIKQKPQHRSSDYKTVSVYKYTHSRQAVTLTCFYPFNALLCWLKRKIDTSNSE